MIIAITGCIGSGKSFYTSKINSIYNYDVFSADTFSKMAYDDERIKLKLNKAFNCVIDNKVNKELIKNKNAAVKFGRFVNGIIHPFVIDKIKEVKEKYKNSIAFIEVPLLFETNIEYLFDFTISISVNDSLRRKRLLNRNASDYKKMIELEKYQYDNDKKASLADYVINSSEDDSQNLLNLEKIIKKIISKEVI